MSIKISNLPLLINGDSSTGWIPISINGITYKILPNQLNSYSLIPNSTVITDINGNITSSLVSSDELFNLKNTTSNVQIQLNNLSAYTSTLSGSSVIQTITDGVTGFSPSSNVIYDAFQFKANTLSPTFAGIPLTPTPLSGDVSTQIANTKFVNDKLSSFTSNLQNSMVIDGTGTKFPTVDAVNLLTNNLAIAGINTGFINENDDFSMIQGSNTILSILPSSNGVIFHSLLTGTIDPTNAIIQVPSIDIPLNTIGLTGTGIYSKYVGITSVGNIVFSDNSYQTSNDTCQLGLLTLRVSGGTTYFINDTSGILNLPRISNYSNLVIVGIGLQTNLVIKPNSGMTISHSNSYLRGMSVNWGDNNINEKLIGQTNIAYFQHLSPSDFFSPTLPVATSAVTTSQYFSGGTLIDLSTSTSASVQRWLLTIEGKLILQYGEMEYPDLNTAVENILITSFIDLLPITSFIEIARMAATKNATNLIDSDKVFFSYQSPISNSTGSNPINWGDINGDINDQTDLKTILDSKAGIISGSTFSLPKILSNNELIDSNIVDNGSIIFLNSDIMVDGSISVNGGSSNQFLKADGSLDSTVYATANSDTLQAVTNRGSGTTHSILAKSFITSGGTQYQFVMGDGSLLNDINDKITGTTNNVPKYSLAGLIDSNITDNGMYVGINSNMIVSSGYTIQIGSDYVISSNDVIDCGTF